MAGGALAKNLGKGAKPSGLPSGRKPTTPTGKKPVRKPMPGASRGGRKPTVGPATQVRKIKQGRVTVSRKPGTGTFGKKKVVKSGAKKATPPRMRKY